MGIIRIHTLRVFLLRILPVILCLSIPAMSIARPLTSLELIERAYRDGEIGYKESLNYKVSALLRPERLPGRFRSSTPIKSGTPIIMEARSNRHLLSPENARLLTRGRTETLIDYYGSGVTLLSYMSPAGHFSVHYTIEGKNAVPSIDDNENGIPDYVEKLARFLDQAWDKEINDMGYDAPPSDGTEGGDCLLDVYLADIPAYGYTQIDEGMSSSMVYMIFDNDFSDTLFPGNLDPGGRVEGDMKVTAAHEFFHTIQFQITEDIENNGWWMEATATWMEDQIYPEVKDYINYLSYWFQNPHLPLDSFDGLFEYGSFMWVKHLTEKYGAGFVFDVWKRIAGGTSALQGIKAALEERGATLEEELKEFRVANITLTYDDGHLYIDIRGGIYARNDQDPFYGIFSIEDIDLSHLSALYYPFSAPPVDGSLTIDFIGNGEIAVMVIGIRPDRPGDTCSRVLCHYDVSEIEPESNHGSITIKGFSSDGPYARVVVIPLNYSATDKGSFSLTVTYSAPSTSDTATVKIRPAATSVVTGDGGSGKQQYYLILKDGWGNQILESGATYKVNSSSPCDGSSPLCVDDNGFATATKAITGALITASLSGVQGIAPSLYSADYPVSMPPGATRSCTIRSSHSDGRCFIATAAFGSPLHPYVRILREFRDRYLLTNDIGKEIVTLYYSYSPPISDVIAKSAPLRVGVQISLIPVIIFAAYMVKATMAEKFASCIILVFFTSIILTRGGRRDFINRLDKQERNDIDNGA